MPALKTSSDSNFMRRALELAARGRGAVEPNPMVGCVIVRDGCIIGEGFHERFGGPHAEPNALASCTESPAGATQKTVHRFRSLCDAILVGINTVLCDDPLLTVRGVEPTRTLARAVLNRDLTIPSSSRLVQSAKASPVLVYCSADAAAQKPQA